MSTKPKIGNRDTFEWFLIACFKAIGADVTQNAPHVGHDLTVTWQGQHLLEVKTTPKSPLTDNEKAKRQSVLAAGGEYHIVITPLEGFKAVGYELAGANFNTLHQLYHLAIDAEMNPTLDGVPPGCRELKDEAGKHLERFI